MNHIYHTIWCKSRNTFVVVPETTASCGKSSSSQKSANRAPLITAALLALSGNVAFADGGIMTNNNSLDYKGAVVDGGASGNSEFFVQNGTTIISNATLTDFSTTGGQGSGGGSGLGGALFVNSGASVILNNVNFSSNIATGGQGGVGTVGGSLNGLFQTGGTAGSTGENGRDAPAQSATVTDGSGWNGYNGQSGGNATAGVGGNGGNGGNGSNGIAPEATAGYIKELADNIYDTATSVKDAQDASAFLGGLATKFGLAAAAASAQVAGPFPVASGLGAVLTSIAQAFITEAALPSTTLQTAEAVKIAADVTYMTALRAAIAEYGTSGSGGDGGKGGHGGIGGDFYGGGKGGNGGSGGDAYSISKAIGGAGGDGGNGGLGGFGAGGGQGGDGGNDGINPSGFVNGPNQGANGDGGTGGFAAGVGASGKTDTGFITGGTGGSGMGGAIFVRSGGNLTITGNATFDNNQVNPGAGQAGQTAQPGQAAVIAGTFGSTAGSDMLIMHGANVVLDPGQDNTIQFNGTIDDDSATTSNNTAGFISNVPTGQGGGLTVASGLVIFNGSDSYTGQTKIAGGVLQADDGTGINKYSNIIFAGGTLQSNGGMTTFSRYLSTAPTGVQWTGAGGFAATGSNALTVSLNNGADLTWGQAHFVQNGYALTFGSSTANNTVNFTNNLNLNGQNQTILATSTGLATAQNLATTNGTSVPSNLATIDATTLSGVLSNGSLTINDATHSGMILLSNANTYAGGTTINGGTLALVKSPTNISNPTSGSLNSTGAVTINNAGVFDISSVGDQAIGTLAGTGSVMLGSNTLTLNQNTDSTFSGSLKDGGLNGGTGAGLIMAGNGALTLSGKSTYTGATQINSGTINLTGSLASNAVNVARGTTLNDTNAGLAGNASLTNAGTVNLGVGDTIASFTNSGTLNGAGQTLTAATYALNSGSVINANLGTGVMTDNGTVTLNGISAAATVDIASGTTTLGSAQRLLNTASVNVEGHLLLGGNQQIGKLFGAGNVDLTLGTLSVNSGNFSGVLQSGNANTGLTKTSNDTLTLSGVNTYTGLTQVNAGTVNLTGSLASAVVRVASGAILNDTSAGLASTAMLSNAGIVNLGANNTIATLINNGTLNGTGETLTAKDYNLYNGSVINANLGTGTLVTSGTVTLNGKASADQIYILAGSTLNLGTAKTSNPVPHVANVSAMSLGTAQTSSISPRLANVNAISLATAQTSDTSSHLANKNASVFLDGILNLNGGDEYVNTLFGKGVVNLSNNQLYIGSGGNFNGSINGSDSNLNVSGGNLSLSNSKITAKSVNVASGGMLTVAGTSVINSPTITLNHNSILNLKSATSSTPLNYNILTGGSPNLSGGTVDAANFTNQSGSSVEGYLTFTGNFVNNGVISPGDDPGFTNIAGNLTNNGTYLAAIKDTAPAGIGYDQIRVGGTVTLNPTSTLIAQSWGGKVFTYGNTYQIISNSTGGSVRSSGTFGNVKYESSTTAAPVSNAAVVFDVNTSKLITTGLNAANSTFADIGTDANQRVAASALMAGATRGVGNNQIDSSTNAGQDAEALLTSNGSINRLVPENYRSMTDFAMLANKAVNNILFSRPLSSTKHGTGKLFEDKSVYIGYTHNQYNVSNDKINRNDFYLGSEGGNDKIALGALFMGSTGSLGSTYGRGTVNGYGGSAYIKAAISPVLRVLGTAGYTEYNYDLNRSGVTGSASGSATGDGINSGLGVTYLAFENDGFSVQPRIGVNYGSASVNGFQETGSSQQKLKIAAHGASRLSGQFGVIVAKDLVVANRPLKVALDVGVDSAFIDNQGGMNATMVNSSSIQFPISSSSNTKTFESYGLSANYGITNYASIYAKYEAYQMDNVISNNGTVDLKISF